MAISDSAARAYPVSGQTNVLTGSPKEIGLLDRMHGLAGGLTDLHLRLEAYSSKLHAHPSAGNPASKDMPPQGVRDLLQTAESELRTCLNMIDDLHSQL